MSVYFLRTGVLLIDGGRAVQSMASIGLAVFGPDTQLTGEQMLVDADVAMYDAKKAGRDRLALFSGSDPHQIELRQRHTWLEPIREALEHDRFVLHGQPIRTCTPTRSADTSCCSDDQRGGFVGHARRVPRPR